MKNFVLLTVGLLLSFFIIALILNVKPLVGVEVIDDNAPGVIRATHVPGELIIGFQAGVTEHDVRDLRDQFGLKIIKNLDSNATDQDRLQKLITAAGPTADVTISTMMSGLSADPRIEYIELNYLYSAQIIPNDPLFEQLWGLHNIGQTGGTPDADIYPSHLIMQVSELLR